MKESPYNCVVQYHPLDQTNNEGFEHCSTVESGMTKYGIAKTMGFPTEFLHLRDYNLPIYGRFETFIFSWF